MNTDTKTAEQIARTCQLCHGAKVMYYGNEDNFTEEPCECQEEAING